MAGTDHQGELVRYYGGLNTWITIGSQLGSSLAKSDCDGLVTPGIQDLINQIIDGSDGIDPYINKAKLFRQDVYWWYLHPRTKAFRFSVERNSCLRIEMSRAALLNLLTTQACQGEKGPAGDDGANGAVGLPGPVELDVPSQTKGQTITAAASVPTPIDTPISIRLFQNDIQLVDIRKPLDITDEPLTFTVSSSFPFTIDEEATIIKFDDQVCTAKIVLADTDEWGEGWTVRMRQVGPDGRDGLDGNTFLQIVNRNVNDPFLRSNNILTSIRNNNDNLFIATNAYNGCIPAAHLKAHNDDYSPFESSFKETLLRQGVYMGSMSPTVGGCAPIQRWEFAAATNDFGSLMLPDWQPDPSCWARGDEAVDFDWVSRLPAGTETPMCEYVETPSMDVKCCQEDFFFCPNLGDACDIESGGEFRVSSSSSSSSSSSIAAEVCPSDYDCSICDDDTPSTFMITLQDVEIIECGGSDDVAAVDCDCSGTNSVTAVSRFRTSNLALNLTDSVAVTDVTVPPDINREFCLEQEIGATEDYCTWRLNDAFSLDITYGLPCDDSTGTDLTAETSLCTVTRSYDIVLRKRDNNQFELTIQTAITAEHNSVVFRGAMFTLNDLCNQSLSFVNDLTGEGTICSGSGDTTVDEEIGADGIAVAIACCS